MTAEPDATQTDHRPAIVICAWDVDEAGWDPVEDLSGEPWNPVGARTVAVPADSPGHLADELSGHLRDPRCRALLLVGRTQRPGRFLLQLRAEHRAPDGSRSDHGTAPSVARATAPIAEMVRALNDAGVPAEATSEADDDSGTFLLYSVLSGLPDGIDTPAIGVLRGPGDASDAAFTKAVKTAAQAMARHMSPISRARAG
jgi:pyrrolidone-carboxylate peptidase